MKVSKMLFVELGLSGMEACADDESVYVETIIGGSRHYYKLTPIEVPVDEYNAAWARASGEEKMPENKVFIGYREENSEVTVTEELKIDPRLAKASPALMEACIEALDSLEYPEPGERRERAVRLLRRALKLADLNAK